MKAKLESICSALEVSTGASWSVYDCGGGDYEFNTYSPAGENVIITLYGVTLAGLAENAGEAWEAFDEEEHAAEILLAKRSGNAEKMRYYAAAPDSLRELLEDAEAVKTMSYGALRDALEAAARAESEAAA